jgi:hypothetical protein
MYRRADERPDHAAPPAPLMRLTLWLDWRTTAEDEAGEVMMAKDIDRPYGRVPVPGECVGLGDDPDDPGLVWPIRTVMWSNSGGAALMLELMTAEDADLDELMGYGFADTR